jgi:hypothetical protein
VDAISNGKSPEASDIIVLTRTVDVRSSMVKIGIAIAQSSNISSFPEYISTRNIEKHRIRSNTVGLEHLAINTQRKILLQQFAI